LHFGELINQSRCVGSRDSCPIKVQNQATQPVEQSLQSHADIETQPCDKNTCSRAIREDLLVENDRATRSARATPPPRNATQGNGRHVERSATRSANATRRTT